MHKLIFANYYLNLFYRHLEIVSISNENNLRSNINFIDTDSLFKELVYVLDIATNVTPTIEIDYSRKKEIELKLIQLEKFFEMGWNRNFSSSITILKSLGKDLNYLRKIKNRLSIGDYEEDLLILNTPLKLFGFDLDLNSREIQPIKRKKNFFPDLVFYSDIFILMIESCEILVSLSDSNDQPLNFYFEELKNNPQSQELFEKRLQEHFFNYKTEYEVRFNEKVLFKKRNEIVTNLFYNEILNVSFDELFSLTGREFSYAPSINSSTVEKPNEDFLKEAAFNFDWLKAIVAYLKNKYDEQNLDESDIFNIIMSKISPKGKYYLERYKLLPIYFHNGYDVHYFPLYSIYDDRLLFQNILWDYLQYGQDCFGETIIHESRFSLPKVYFYNTDLLRKVFSVNSQYLFQMKKSKFRENKLDSTLILCAMMCYLNFMYENNIDPRQVFPEISNFDNLLNSN
jgi:hypothetical protein